jgi:hypothetical protein
MNTVPSKRVMHNGNYFRSVTEWRWALVMENLEIQYHFEAKKFNTKFGWYLPDFFLPAFNCWIEIKGSFPTAEEVAKCRSVHESTGNPVLMLSGAPDIQSFSDGVRLSNFGLKLISDEPSKVVNIDLGNMFDEVGSLTYNKIPVQLYLISAFQKAKNMSSNEHSLTDLLGTVFRTHFGADGYVEQEIVNAKKPYTAPTDFEIFVSRYLKI